MYIESSSGIDKKVPLVKRNIYNKGKKQENVRKERTSKSNKKGKRNEHVNSTRCTTLSITSLSPGKPKLLAIPRIMVSIPIAIWNSNVYAQLRIWNTSSNNWTGISTNDNGTMVARCD